MNSLSNPNCELTTNLHFKGHMLEWHYLAQEIKDLGIYSNQLWDEKFGIKDWKLGLNRLIGDIIIHSSDIQKNSTIDQLEQLDKEENYDEMRSLILPLAQSLTVDPVTKLIHNLGEETHNILDSIDTQIPIGNEKNYWIAFLEDAIGNYSNTRYRIYNTNLNTDIEFGPSDLVSSMTDEELYHAIQIIYKSLLETLQDDSQDIIKKIISILITKNDIKSVGAILNELSKKKEIIPYMLRISSSSRFITPHSAQKLTPKLQYK